jgi:hypothetical protein
MTITGLGLCTLMRSTGHFGKLIGGGSAALSCTSISIASTLIIDTPILSRKSLSPDRLSKWHFKTTDCFFVWAVAFSANVTLALCFHPLVIADRQLLPVLLRTSGTVTGGPCTLGSKLCTLLFTAHVTSLRPVTDV